METIQYFFTSQVGIQSTFSNVFLKMEIFDSKLTEAANTFVEAYTKDTFNLINFVNLNESLWVEETLHGSKNT